MIFVIFTVWDKGHLKGYALVGFAILLYFLVLD
jgi:hypothetical protein